MELKCVGTVTMSDFIFKTLRQIDDLDGLERALLDALTTANAHVLTNETDRGSGQHLNTDLACFVYRTRLLALLLALLGLALIGIDNGNSQF